MKPSDIAHLSGNTGPKMAFAFDTKSKPGCVIVHTVQFSTLEIPVEQFSEASFKLPHADNDLRAQAFADGIISVNQ